MRLGGGWGGGKEEAAGEGGGVSRSGDERPSLWGEGDCYCNQRNNF
jgi:hypothetical protein